MIKNYLLIAFRNVLKYKGFSLINILGLSLSMAVCMLIMIVIQDQLSYDEMHTKKKHIYRIQQVDSLANVGLRMASNPYPLGIELRDNYAIAEKVLILNDNFRTEGLYNDTRLTISGLYTSTDFFDVFDFKLELGSAQEILDEPYSIILSRETADRFFGDENPIGKFIEIDSLEAYEVKGVVEKTKQKSHIQFDALISLSTLEIHDQKRDKPLFVDNWETGWGSWIYLLLDEESDLGSIQNILDKISIEKYKDDEDHNYSFYLQPLEKIVPGPLLGNEIGSFMPKVFIIFLAGLALVIIISAAFNYTSLSMARSMLRAREVGVRKTFGAARSQVIIQFLSESILISLISFLLAIVILQFLLPAFTGMQMMSMLEVKPEQNITIYLWFLIFALGTGLLSGMLPAFLISAFKPAAVLKGITNIKFFSRLTLRKVLLATQFVFSIVFIISILLIFKQMNYMINADMGFDAEIVYDVELQGKDFEKVKAAYSQLPEVVNITASSHIPGEGNFHGVDVRMKMEDDKYECHCFSVDENHIETIGLNLIAGRNFPDNLSSENEKFVIASEMIIEQFQLGNALDALGTTLILDDSSMVEIIGIIKDYQYGAVLFNQKPLLLRYGASRINHAFLRISSPDMPASVSKLEKTWNEIDPEHDLNGDFIDDRIKNFYSLFEDITYTVGFATLLAIMIACFGLLGIATYSTQTRLKEIGIRKVLGADVKSIVLLVSKSYLWLIVIAAVIGGIIAYLVNNLWLHYIAKRVDFGIGTILTGVFLVVFVGLLTISTQTLRAARTKPVSTLKND
jgi:putative ABC transport system permease protein